MSRMILLADDSITIQKIVHLTFSGEGIDVVTVGNGDAALRKIHEHRPSLVLADIFMPGKNGYEVCETIKNDAELQSIPVILLVGAFEPFDGQEAARVRADSHLTKPFEIKALISAVRSLIEAAEQQAAVMTEPVSAQEPSVETIEEPIDAAAPPASLQEEAVYIEDPPIPALSDFKTSGVITEKIQEIPTTEEPAVVPEQPIVLAETTFRETPRMSLPVIEETDPLGLESVEDGMGLAGVPGEGLTDTKSMVVEIWEAAEIPVVTERAFLMAEVLPQRSSDVESGGAGIDRSSPPPTDLVAPVESSERVQDVPVMQPASSLPPSPRGSWGETETAELVDLIASRVVEKLSREVIEKIAWEVIPDMAVLMIKDQVESHFKTINDR